MVSSKEIKTKKEKAGGGYLQNLHLLHCGAQEDPWRHDRRVDLPLLRARSFVMYLLNSRVDMVVVGEPTPRIDIGTDAVDGSLGISDASCLGSVRSCMPRLFTKKLNAPTVKSKPDSRPENVSRSSGECGSKCIRGADALFAGEAGGLPLFERVGELPCVA